MSGGLAALLDDVATLARAAATSVDDIAAATGKAGAKAAGVVIDDAAVTPQYVTGIQPKREIPMIWRIAKGSLVNKLIIILPIALLLSQFLPWLLTPILMLGGTYLCFEGMEKVWEKLSQMFSGESEEERAAREAAVAEREPADEDSLVKSAIFTDLILSAEIMVISLNEVAHEPLLNRAVILVVVGIAITLLVYGVVGLLVKIDDIGMAMAERSDGAAGKFGLGMVRAMPVVLNIIGIIGTFAMLWVGGHIMIAGVDELGWHAPHELVHHLETMVPAGFAAWLVNTACSLVVGAIWGAIFVAVMHVLPFGHGDDHDGAGDGEGDGERDGHGGGGDAGVGTHDAVADVARTGGRPGHAAGAHGARIRASAGSMTPGGYLVDRDAGKTGTAGKAGKTGR